MNNCDTCGAVLLPSGTQCHQCESPIGFPNVRKAVSEKSKLLERYNSAQNSIILRDIVDVAINFEQYVEHEAKLILAKPVIEVLALTNPNKLMTTYHKEIRANARTAEDNQYDQNRDGFESIINPQYHENIQYAALSLTDKGLTYYGGVHLTLNLNKVKHRTTLFEENSYNFVVKHKLTGVDVAPEGYRATWEDKTKLAVVKCNYKLNKNTSENMFSTIIINDDPANPEFIEAHIYGNLGAATVDNMLLGNSACEDDVLMFKASKNAFRKLGINIQIES
tara:strand:- start:1344 stop:2180 length:837 start_codon:yes stop_codon:yes gene_type:complete